jgi:hypothetical protein
MRAAARARAARRRIQRPRGAAAPHAAAGALLARSGVRCGTACSAFWTIAAVLAAALDCSPFSTSR